ncbi:MAG: hypothetical protein IKW81_08500 [Pseudobutyrivibrio sp.]|nr:hypothetical protein [Pseudobutyrivibrio sp.]
MDSKIILEKQDLKYLKWSHVRSSSGTTGTFLKSASIINGHKIYYKLSNYDSEKGIVGHECINEIIVDRLLSILGVEHLHYQLIHADIEIDGKDFETWICASEDFKKPGETKSALDGYFQSTGEHTLSRYDFCKENGWQKYIDTMLAVDYLIMNRDRHGANIEVLRNARKKTLRIAPLFDHGLSLLCSCTSEEAIEDFDISVDKKCQNYIGSSSTKDNLSLIKDKKSIFKSKLKQSDREFIFEDLNGIISEKHMDKIWNMIWERWTYYESLCNS